MGDKQLCSKHPLYFKAAESYGDHHLISVFGEKKWLASFFQHLSCGTFQSQKCKKKIFFKASKN